jgi:hypothetical protein
VFLEEEGEDDRVVILKDAKEVKEAGGGAP